MTAAGAHVDEQLARLAVSGVLRSRDLEPLLGLMAALENSRAAGVDDVASGLRAALGDEAATSLCSEAAGVAVVAARFFRLRALLCSAETLGPR